MRREKERVKGQDIKDHYVKELRYLFLKVIEVIKDFNVENDLKFAL